MLQIPSYPLLLLGFPGGSAVKNPLANAGDPCSVPALGRSPGEGNSNSLQYCLRNPMDRGASQATVLESQASDTTEQLNNNNNNNCFCHLPQSLRTCVLLFQNISNLPWFFSLAHMLFRSVLFRYLLLGDFPVIFLLLTSGLIPLWFASKHWFLFF